ncbi:MAG: phenylalanine--tRNA ligase subunit beta [Planctomycetota bacterium]
MFISYDWLNDFVDLSHHSPEEVGEQLSLKTAEVEGLETVRRVTDQAVCAEILSAEPIAAEPRLKVVKLSLGSSQAQTVCGAPNARVGLKAAFLGVGATMPNGKTIQATELQGEKSEGVLCSPSELGLGTAHEQLLELPASTPAGRRLAEDCPATDTLIEIDNKSLTHRPDLWGHYGFARELASIFGVPLKPYDGADLSAHGGLPKLKIEVEDHAVCPVYTGITLDVSDNPPSPLWMQRRLTALGIASKNVLVDLSNYVQLEIGQPNHAFDASTVSDGIRVANAGSLKEMHTLDGEERKLIPEDLLIWSGDRAVALAGIMGGEGSQIQPGTKSVLLESANFDATRVRRTSGRLALRTDASLRFEKKLPPMFARQASERFVKLLGDSGVEATATSSLTVVGDLHDRSRPISVPAGYLTKRAGVEVSNQRATSILTSIGFGVSENGEGGLDVEIPSFRGLADIAITEDILEEVTRLYGYDHIEPKLPGPPITPVDVNRTVRGHHRIRRVLSQGSGFVEVQSYAWISDPWAATIGHEPVSPLVLKNPSAEGKARMRDALVPNLLEFAHQNRKQFDDFKIFELGKVFWSDKEGRSTEQNQLAGVSVCQSKSLDLPQHLQQLRASLDTLATAAALPPFEYRVTQNPCETWTVGGYAMTILSGAEAIGSIGVLKPSVQKATLDAGHAVWFWLLPDAISGEPHPKRGCEPIPTFPGSWQDLTLVWPREKGYEGLAGLLDSFEHELLERSEFRGAYDPEGSTTSNYTFRFFLRAPGRTMSNDDRASFRSAIESFMGERSIPIQ